jgi:hypothetical protein
MGIMMSMQPEKIPADPRPAIARPMMKEVDVGAAPQRALPASNIMTLIRNVLKSWLAST